MGVRVTMRPVRVVPRRQKPKAQSAKPPTPAQQLKLTPEQEREAFLKDAESYLWRYGVLGNSVVFAFADPRTGDGVALEFPDADPWIYAGVRNEKPDPFAYFYEDGWTDDGSGVAQKITPKGWGFRLNATGAKWWFWRDEAMESMRKDAKTPLLRRQEPQPYSDSVMTARIWQDADNIICTDVSFTPPDADDFG